ncbi:MAG: MG2 domain-containing protein [Bacteroidota bacterium]
MTHAQEPSSYPHLWKQVEQLEQQAMTKSALKIVESISVRAKKEGNAAQTVKALLYISKYALILEEEAQLNIVDDFKVEISKAHFPVGNVLESYLANLYWQFFQNNRYRFYNRTQTETKIDPDDFRTWDLNTLFKEIDLHFRASLENAKELQQLNLADFKEILHRRKGSETYRPTLFDLLAHTALNFYKTDENNITRPADKFEIDNPEILCEAYQFTQKHIPTKDNTSLQTKALKTYQELVKFHFSDLDLRPLADVDIERLRFIRQHAVFENKDHLYLEVLQNSAENLRQHEVSGLYRYEMALLYHEWGNQYQPKTNAEHRWKQKEALGICESVIAQFPDSPAAEKCKALKSTLLSKSLSLQTERFVPLNTASRILVNYKNLEGLTFTAYRVTQDQLDKVNKIYPEAKQLAYIKKMKVAQEWQAALKDEKDYQQHGMEVLLPPLENGQYLILALPVGESNGTFAFGSVQATNMALIETRTPDFHSFQLIDRSNGTPLSKATLLMHYQENYDRAFKTKSFVTNSKGQVQLPLPAQRWTSLGIKAAHLKETAYFGKYYINRKRNAGVRHTIHYNAFLFTDRSIYRPGQTAFFKGILTVKEPETPAMVQPNTAVTVTLRDANYQEVAQQHFTTNEYGSLSGEFVLPTGGLLGNYTLQMTSKEINLNGTANFSVEEYKRPKFQTSFEPIRETFRVNDPITIKGEARAYAGSPITDAKVRYRVKRVVYFPRWYYWSRPNFNTSPQEIAFGETKTDASGAYQIRFKAIPDNSVNKENLPVFRYEVTAEVTDINGETRTATRIVRVGYHTLATDISMADKLDKAAKDNTITLSTTNLNQQFVPAKGTLKLYKLKAPEQVLRNRPWPAPDYPHWTKTEFKALFPQDAYTQEYDPTTWEKGEMVWTSDFDTKESKKIPLKTLKKWESGKYVLELETKDRFGQIVKDKAITTLYSDKDGSLADKQLFDIQLNKTEYGIDDMVKVIVASAAQDLSVTFTVEKDGKAADTRIVHLSNDTQSFTVPVAKDDLGGFSIHYSFSAFNAFTSGVLPVSVPYPSTELEVKTLAFRDKLKPNAEETWTFTLKGPKGEKVAAEILASMYDASLDAFRGHDWLTGLNPRPNYYASFHSNAYQSFGNENFRTFANFDRDYSYTPQNYDAFNWFGLFFAGGRDLSIYREHAVKRSGRAAPVMSSIAVAEGMEEVEDASIVFDAAPVQEVEIGRDEKDKEGKQTKETDFRAVAIRKNLRETAFFLPHLQTDKEGHVSFSFTTPEALTTWRLQLLAHTKNLNSRYAQMEAVTQKELMVLPNVPRFLREGDAITISTKIANLTDKKLSGTAKLKLTDAVSGKDVTQEILAPSASGTSPQGGGTQMGKNFAMDSLGNTQVSWYLEIPKGLQAVQYTILAKAGQFSDGEQGLLPVLTNRMLVTETLPMWVRSDQIKTFTLEKLKNNASRTLNHHKLTLEMTSNPAWYAVQALPYLMEYPHDCNEQIFARYYANSLASYIATSNPRIKEVFDQWRNSDALLSNLEKNQELKSLLIQETPWLRDAQSETEQKKRIALLFDLNKMKSEKAGALHKLEQNQMSNGAWAWFKGGRANRYITQHIVTGLGHLEKLVSASLNNIGTSATLSTRKTHTMLQKAIAYLDAEFIQEYEEMKKHSKNLREDHLSAMQIQYLYMRSFYPKVKASTKVAEVMAYYKGQAQKYWTKRGLYTKGLLALALYRMDDVGTANKILRSLEENSITNEELGMYWKENTASWHWYRAPIETQALMIEAFSEISHPGTDRRTLLDNLKIWLLKNKQTNQWKTTKATTEAVYALLLQGSDWLSATEAVEVTVGGKKITPSQLENVKVEAGTGYYKTAWNGSKVSPKMAEVQLRKKGKGMAWGALYWQYFEDLDRITHAETPLQLQKKLFLRKNTETGELISEINAKTRLQVGDLVRVRIELRADRNMEFVHMKDMRASGLEPVNVLSQYKWQDGLGYYESTKDASTNFFFDYLPKGVYVFEYDLYVNNAGDFSNGITTIQSMYAPEFSSHSEGTRVVVGSGQ